VGFEHEDEHEHEHEDKPSLSLTPCIDFVLFTAIHDPVIKIFVAYSGGLDTAVILKGIKEAYSAEMIAFCADIGQEEELDGLEEKALKTGASKCYIDDLRDEFARDFIYPMLQVSALYE